MSTKNEEEIRPEEKPNQGLHKEIGNNYKGNSTTQVLKTMKNLIMELQVFKVYKKR
jgi:hypothetical protein